MAEKKKKKRVGDDFGEPMDGHQTYEDETKKFNQEYWKKNDPEFHALMERLKRTSGPNKKTT